MITIAQQTKLKKILKSDYSKDIQAILNEKGVVNKLGNPYGQSFITHVFNGRYSNEVIEDSFFELYQKRIDIQSKKKTLRKQILENKKPEAGTSGLI